MIVYLEYLIIINILIHYFIIKFCAKIFLEKINKKRLLVSFFLVVINLCIYLNYPFIGNIVKYPFGFLIIYSIFRKSKIKKCFNIFIVYFIINILLGGFSFFFEVYNLNLNLSLLISFILMIIIFELNILPRISEGDFKKCFYNIFFVAGGKSYYYQFFLDTGNFSKNDKDNLPVVILNEKHQMLFKPALSIRIGSLTEDSNLNIYRVDEFYIMINNEFKKREVYLAFGKVNFDGIFGLDLLKE